jgi:hypothetical protein
MEGSHGMTTRRSCYPSATLTAVALAAGLCVWPSEAQSVQARARTTATAAVNIRLSDIVAGRGGFVIDGDTANLTAGYRASRAWAT